MRLLGLALLTLAAFGQIATPDYASASVVHAATGERDLCPGAIASLYGQRLSFGTQGLGSGDIRNGFLPTSLGSVNLLVGGLLAPLYYVSPGQINFQVPVELSPGRATLRVVRQGIAGPAVQVMLTDVAPGLFRRDPVAVAATHLDGQGVTAENPAVAGRYVVLYAAGLGPVVPSLSTGELAGGAHRLRAERDVTVLLDGQAVEPGAVAYAGAVPGTVGLYQINLLVPSIGSTLAEVRVALGEWTSPPGLLPVTDRPAN